jgi:hypothetical protein
VKTAVQQIAVALQKVVPVILGRVTYTVHLKTMPILTTSKFATLLRTKFEVLIEDIHSWVYYGHGWKGT